MNLLYRQAQFRAGLAILVATLGIAVATLGIAAPDVPVTSAATIACTGPCGDPGGGGG